MRLGFAPYQNHLSQMHLVPSKIQIKQKQQFKVPWPTILSRRIQLLEMSNFGTSV